MCFFTQHITLQTKFWVRRNSFLGNISGDTIVSIYLRPTAVTRQMIIFLNKPFFEVFKQSRYLYFENLVILILN